MFIPLINKTMTSIEAKREEFRKYLEESGVVSALTHALIKLYEEEHKPMCAVKYVRQQMCETCPTEEQFYELRTNYEDASDTIVQLETQLTKIKDNLKRTPSEVAIQLETGFMDLEQDDSCKSLLKKCMTRDIFNSIKELKTPMGTTLLDCIQSGLENRDSSIGIYAADVEAYNVFSDLFDPIIEECHIGFAKDAVHPELNWGDPTTLQNLDPENKYIVSTRIRCARSIEGYPLVGKMAEQQFRDIMGQAQVVLENMEGDFRGTFCPLLNMTKEVQDQLVQDHFMFEPSDRFLQSARACRFWPQGRALFYNEEKSFLVWVNEEDHLRLISMQPGGDIAVVYQRLINGIEAINENMKFVRHSRLGYITFCPSNLGSTIRASVHIRLPQLGADCTKLQETAAKYNLQVRGTKGENTDAEDWVYDISNKRRLGLSEFDAVKEMSTGIEEIIRVEQEMEE